MVVIEKHVVCYATQAWGHLRPLIHLSARFVKLRPVVVTLLVSNGYYDRINTELSRSFEEDDEEHAKRIRRAVIAVGDIQGFSSEEFDRQFEAAWKALDGGSELICSHTGARHSALPKPQAAILDCFAADGVNSIKAVSGDTVKIYGWHPGLTYALINLFAPERYGGRGNLRLKAEEKARLTGRPYEEVAIELTFRPGDNVVRLSGVPPMYEYEHWPQDLMLPPGIGAKLFPRVFETLEKTDGVFLFTPESYEPEAVATVRRWYGETGRPAYAVGPLLPAASKAAAASKERKLSSESDGIQTFLDDTLKSCGEQSLVYISFGSMLWPAKSPEKIWAFVDVLTELNIPFILSTASPTAVVSDEIKAKVKAYGKGLLSPWTPQQLILDHLATGWFVAHGGHNGVTEAISAGVPQILWPFGGDQALNAVLITDIHKIGYELLEVRTGSGLKPIYRTGFVPKNTVDALKAEAREVLAKAFGENGKEKRARLEEVRKGVTAAWKEGGSSWRDASGFLDSL
ncbi:UDP-Glycosyltransferase/glycogen phosphorylase [Fomes fomentarius]|nr:UDP-Glycosyltransferase/glycogen phosphorylase [Fomes fomentarius]